MGMLARFRTMVADEGQLLLGSMMLADVELADHARFVRGAYASDPPGGGYPAGSPCAG